MIVARSRSLPSGGARSCPGDGSSSTRGNRMSDRQSGRPPPVDTSWAQNSTARFVRRFIHGLILEPILEIYTHPTVVGRENLAGLDGPVIFAANHSSHIDTPILLRALPVRWRERTVVAAAADYFFRKKPIAWSVALVFGAVPIE